MFWACNSLKYLKLYLYKIKTNAKKESAFPSNIKTCTRQIDSESNIIIINCSDTCNNERNIKIDITNNQCIESCHNNLYEYNNFCITKCTKGFILNNNICVENYCKYNNIIDCSGLTPKYYYLDKIDYLYKKCHQNCNYCYGEGNNINNNCIECISSYIFLNESNSKNCYEKCQIYYYFDEFNNYKCTQNYECPQKFNKLIIEKNKCIDDCKNDNIYKYEYNGICYIQNSNNIINEITDINIENFRNLVLNYDISNIDNNNIIQEDKYKGIIYQLTNSNNQKNNTNKNISTINLGDCEKKLKDKYGINESLPLIILKIDYYSSDTLIPIIGYEIYHPLNKTKLDLNHCKDKLIQLNIPVSIDESKLFKYDPNSGFYTDNCFSYTTENGTDIILNDRKKEFSEKNLSLCENKCNYTGYKEDTKQSTCKCFIKNKLDLINDIINNPNKLANNFESDNLDINKGSSNILTIKCTKELFSKEGLINNISSYILIIFFGYFLLCIILFIKCGYPLLKNEIKKITDEKQNVMKNKCNINHKITQIKSNTKSKSKLKNKFVKKNARLSQKRYYYNLNIINYVNLSKEKTNSNYILKNKNNSRLNQNTKKERTTKLIFKKSKINKIKYNDYELNTFDYKNALINDRRTFCEYYSSLLKRKNFLLFSFCPIKDFNSMIIKSSILCLSFSIYYAIDFIFFNDEIIHKLYEEGGKYDIIYFLPKIIISFAISHIITIFIKFIFLSERNIANIKQQLTSSLAYNISLVEKRNLIIKYTIYFISGIIFLVFFWMLLSSFGAVYQNTQIYIFENALLSFTLSFFYTFLFNILPSIFRILSLSSKNNKYIYQFSKFLQLL